MTKADLVIFSATCAASAYSQTVECLVIWYTAGLDLQTKYTAFENAGTTLVICTTHLYSSPARLICMTHQ